MKRAVRPWWVMARVMLPVLILMRFLENYGFISFLTQKLTPIFSYMGLGGEASLIWIPAMFVNIYAGLAVYLELLNQHSFSVAETSILMSMLLIAHSLPSEIAVTKLCGLKVMVGIFFRLSSALLFGFVLYWLYRIFDEEAFSRTVHVTNLQSWLGTKHSLTWLEWFQTQVIRLLWIYLIILLLFWVVDFCRFIGLVRLMMWALFPVWRLLGFSKAVAEVVVAANLIGVSYGAGLMLRTIEEEKPKMSELISGLLLVSIFHGIVEDTLLMLAAGAQLWAILLARFLFTLLLMMPISFVLSRSPMVLRWVGPKISNIEKEHTI